MAVQTTPSAPGTDLNGAYFRLLAPMQRRFTALVQAVQGPPHLFITEVPALYTVFLDALPPELRQEHACSACRRFVEHYGRLVQISGDGKTTAVMWDAASAPEPYAAAIAAVAAAVARAPITGVFLTREKVWGQPETGPWRHFAVTPPASCVHQPSPVQTTGALAAEKRQEYAMLVRGLEEFSLELVRNAHTLLTSEQLYRSEKCIGVAKWLLDLHERRARAKDTRTRDNLTWLAVAGAPAGFCHVRSGMIGTLLEDLALEMPFADIKARFDAKMHPLQYQRPTAAPSAGNIAAAERIVEHLRSSGALERRFARLADIVPLWLPKPAKAAKNGGKRGDKDGVFSHVKRKGAPEPAQVDVPPVTMTWEKFARTVLPTAEQIEYFVPRSNQSYAGLVTAKNPDAPPIVQWDSEERRNPVTWYFYANNTPATRWNLPPGAYHPVTAITLQPSMWHEPEKYKHQGEKVFFLLAGARDTEYTSGSSFFPEVLKREYHPIRATIEAYAKSAVVAGKDEAEACGIGLARGGTWDHLFRVTTRGGVRISYKLDRWD